MGHLSAECLTFIDETNAACDVEPLEWVMGRVSGAWAVIAATPDRRPRVWISPQSQSMVVCSIPTALTTSPSLA
jgi:hypothetical protein